jgi:hypothetical protein
MEQPVVDSSQDEPREIVLRFCCEGAAFDRAKTVADKLGLDMEAYLLRCLKEGHELLKSRQIAAAALADEFDVPSFLRQSGAWPLVS